MRAAELHRLIENLLRLGTVAEVDPGRARVRVRIGDLVTTWLPWQSPRAGTTAEWDPPTVGEQVLVLSPGGDPAAGIVVSGLFSTARPAPASSAALHRRAYPDGTLIDYDHEAGVLSVDCVGDVIVKGARNLTVDFGGDVLVRAPAVTVDAPQSTFKGAVTVEGLLSYLAGLSGSNAAGGAAGTIQGTLEVTGGDVTADGISLTGHVHPENNDTTTGAPQ